jgi:hypothetical protein
VAGVPLREQREGCVGPAQQSGDQGAGRRCEDQRDGRYSNCRPAIMRGFSRGGSPAFAP